MPSPIQPLVSGFRDRGKNGQPEASLNGDHQGFGSHRFVQDAGKVVGVEIADIVAGAHLVSLARVGDAGMSSSRSYSPDVT